MEGKLREFREHIAGTSPRDKNSLLREVTRLLSTTSNTTLYNDLSNVRDHIREMETQEDRIKIDNWVCDIINERF